MDTDSDDYHDYVIKDGVLVREFEQMYLHSTEVPWHQDDQESQLDVCLTVGLLRWEGESFGRIIDYGCGYGYYLNLISSSLTGSHKCYGFDISKTAVAKANSLFPEFTCHEANLTLPDNQQLVLPSETKSTLHMIRGTLWYVYPELEIVVANLIQQLAPQDTLLVVQNFPPLDSNFVGKHVIPSPTALRKYFIKAGARCVRYLWCEEYGEHSNDSWFIGTFRKGC